MAGLAEIGDKLLSNYGNTTRLKDGIAIQELIEKMATEFTLDSNTADFKDPFEEQSSIEKLYDYEEFEPYMNFDCVSSAGEGNKFPFEELKTKMTPVTEDGKVLKRLLKEGSGESVPPTAVVYYHYNSYFELEMIPFDSSNLRQQKPVRGQVGVGTMYQGFEISLMSMKAGEKSQFLVHPDYAFGPLGAPPRIPPNSTILLEIQLFKVVDCGAATENPVDEISEKVSFEDCYKKAKAYHLLGNDYFQSKNMQLALKIYKCAEKELLKCSMENDDEENKFLKLLLKVYVNICICFNNPKINSPESVCSTAREAFHVCYREAPKCVKLLFNLAKAQSALNDFNKAKKNLKLAFKLEPQNHEINRLLKEIERKEKEVLQEEKVTYQWALGLSSPNKKIDTNKPDKIVSTPEKYSEFEQVLRDGLEEFASDRDERLDLPPAFTKEEIAICKKVCGELGLQFVDKTICGKRSFYVSKRESL